MSIAIYQHAVRVRLLDERLTQLARAEIVGYHPAGKPFELAVAAAALAGDGAHVVFPSARDHAALLARGESIDSYLAHVFATSDDRALGHADPGCLSSKERGIASPSAFLANHLTHAVGHAWAASLAGRPSATLALCAEAAVHAAEFHSALNFAGVSRTPVVFLCRVDRTRDITARLGESVLDKAVAYGLTTDSVSASDADAIQESIARGLSAKTPTLIEVVHAGSEDPLDAARARLIARGMWDPIADLTFRRETMAQFEHAIAFVRSASKVAGETIFQQVFAT